LRKAFILVGNMNAKHYRWVILPMVGGFIALPDILPSGLVLGLHQTQSDGTYHIEGGSAPWALDMAALSLAVYFLLMFAPAAELGQAFFGWWRRTLAFCIDMVFAVAMLSPVAGLIPVLMEWKRTGVFAWTFARSAPAAGDYLMSAALFILMASLLVLYFAFPLIRNRPSPGSCAMGYQIVQDDGGSIPLKVAVYRTLAGIAFLGDRWRQGARIDGWFGTHAVKLK
jgi:uncharacterized RDD family membrane protein YckC